MHGDPDQAAGSAGNSPPGNIFLVGLMGAGKTSVGRLLARHLGKTFVDSDHEIEARTGVSIPTIFEIEGEEGFRDREERIIDELTRRPDVVVATGGGAVLRPANRHALATRGLVIYLRASVGELYARTRHDRNRPLLQTADPKARLEALFDVRDPLYREIAGLTVDSGRQSVHTLVRRLARDITDRLAAMPPYPGD